jgi:hypothetical protein
VSSIEATSCSCRRQQQSDRHSNRQFEAGLRTHEQLTDVTPRLRAYALSSVRSSGREPSGDAPPDPGEHEAVPSEVVDRWLEPLCERVYGAFAVENPEHLRLAFMQAGARAMPGAAGEDLHYVVAAGALGYHARAAELEELGLDARIEPLAALLLVAEAEARYGEGWFAAITGVAEELVDAALAPGPPSEDVAALLGPEGMGADARRRFGAHQLIALPHLVDEPRPDDVPSEALARAWWVGYHLHACESALPPDVLDDFVDRPA